MKLMSKLMLAALLIALLATPALTRADDAPLADRIPGGSVVYVGWGGLAAHQGQLDKTGLVRLFNDPEVKPHLDAMLAQLETFLKKQADENLPPNTYGPIRSLLLDVVVDRPWAAALVDVKLPGQEGVATPSAEAVLVVDLADRSDKAAADIAALIKAFVPAEEQGRIKPMQIRDALLSSVVLEEDVPPLVWGVYRKHLLVALSDKAAGKVIALMAGEGSPLSKDAQFKTVVDKVGAGLLVGYGDVARFRKDLMPMLVAMGTSGMAEAAEVNKIIEATGGNAVDAVAFSVRAEGGHFVQQSFVLAPRGKPGVLALADQKPLNKQLLAVAPADATFASFINLDKGKLLAELDKQLAQWPEVKAEYDQGRKSLDEMLTVNLKTDVIDALGDGLAVYNSPSAGGFVVTAATIVMEVKDRDKLANALKRIEGALLEMAGPDAEDVRVKVEKFNGHEVRYLAVRGVFMPFAPAWCVTEKYLVISTFPQSAKEALLQIDRGGKDAASSLLGNDTLVKRMDTLGKGASAISYTNERQLIRIAYPIVLPIWQGVCAMAAGEGVELNVNAMPRQQLLMQHLTDGFGAMVPEADGIRFLSVSSLPSSSSVGSMLLQYSVMAPMWVLGARPASRDEVIIQQAEPAMVIPDADF